MGLMCAKLRRCCCCEKAPAAQARRQQFKVLLLGAAGSGKTQLGHMLSERERDADDMAPTNGVRCYEAVPTEAAAPLLLLTEVGGSVDMQRIWPHYYAACHALIFCFDLSGSDAQLQQNFALLRSCLQHASLRGKPVLLVAARQREGVQLYDVEYAFGLEQLAQDCGSPLHFCHMTREELMRGLDWLRRQLHEQAAQLTQRIKYDVNLQVHERKRDRHMYTLTSLNGYLLLFSNFQSWQQRRRALLSSSKLAQVHRQRFRRRHRKVRKNQPCLFLSHSPLSLHPPSATALATATGDC